MRCGQSGATPVADNIDRVEGRKLFGSDPEGYEAARPAYPDWIFDTLIRESAIYKGARALEIGPGPGTVTRRLLDLGVDPLTLIEPDKRFTRILGRTADAASASCALVQQSFEAAP